MERGAGVREPLRKVKAAVTDAWRHRYRPWSELPGRIARNARLPYTRLGDAEIRSAGRSDVLFVVCSGPSVLSVSPVMWNEIASHDTMGINFSFLLPFRPTYHIFSWERDVAAREFMVRKFAAHHGKFSDTVMLVSSKALYRMAHPRLLPEYYPPHPRVWYFDIPRTLSIADENDFDVRQFNETLFYRNTSSLALHLAIRKMGYKKIVMLGVDLDTPKHFFYDMPDMQELVARQHVTGGDRFGKLACMIPKQNKMLTFEQYLVRLADYLKAEEGCTLYTATPDSYMAKWLPSFLGAEGPRAG